MIRSLNIWFAACMCFAAVVMSQATFPGSARAETKRVAILEFEGQSASAFHAQISSGLKGQSGVEIVSPREVKSTASRLGNSMSSSSDIKELGEALELSAVIEGSAVKKQRDLVLTVKVRNAATGEVVHEEVWRKRRSQMKSIKPTVWSKLGPAIEGTSPPGKAKAGKTKTPPPPVATKPTKPVPVAEPEDEEEAERIEEEALEDEPKPKKKKRVVEEDEDEARKEEEALEDEPKPKKKSRPGNRSVEHPALIAAIGPRIMWRTLSYDGDTNLNSYTSTDQGSPSFNLGISAQYFPGAHKSTEWYSDFGIDFDLDYAIGLKSQQDNKKLSTTAYEVDFGAIYRHRWGAFIPRIKVDYVKHVFDVKVPSTILLPSISYSALKFNIGTAIDIVDWWQIDASFGYLPVFSAGELNEKKYGDKVSTGAWEAGAGVLMRLKEVYGIRLAVDYRRYNYDFGLSTNMNIALPKTGTDSYLRTTLSFVYTMPGAK